MSAPLLVTDSGPLIALARLDLLELPGRLFTQALVPATVWQEFMQEPRPAEQPRLHAAQQAGWLQVVPGTVRMACGAPGAGAGRG